MACSRAPLGDMRGAIVEPEEDEVLTASEIAARTGVSRKAVSVWRQRSNPSWPTAHSVSRSGRDREGFKWSEVQEFLLAHGLPNTGYQDVIRRAIGGKRDTGE